MRRSLTSCSQCLKVYGLRFSIVVPVLEVKVASLDMQGFAQRSVSSDADNRRCMLGGLPTDGPRWVTF